MRMDGTERLYIPLDINALFFLVAFLILKHGKGRKGKGVWKWDGMGWDGILIFPRFEMTDAVRFGTKLDRIPEQTQSKNSFLSFLSLFSLSVGKKIGRKLF
jgi:hypothetical protein